MLKLVIEQKLKRSNDKLKANFKLLDSTLLEHSDVRLIKSKRFMTYKYKNKPICRMQIKGKTLNVYLALNPTLYNDSKYVFIDASSIKVFENYPMRMKITSPRQLRWTKELIELLIVKAQYMENVYE